MSERIISNARCGVDAPIHYVVDWTIPPGVIDQFQALAAEATALVVANEPEMLVYDWYFDAGGTRCTLLERYPSAAHILKHRQNLAAVLARLLELASYELRVFGGLDTEAQAVLAERGVQYGSFFVGLGR